MSPAARRLTVPALYLYARDDPLAEVNAPQLYRATKAKAKQLVSFPGYDLKAIRVTNRQIPGPKPVFFLMATSLVGLLVLELAAGKAGWGKPLPAGHGRGIAVHESFGSFIAQVAEVSVDNKGAIRVHRVVCAIDCGRPVNPATIEAQMESGVVFGTGVLTAGHAEGGEGRVQIALLAEQLGVGRIGAGIAALDVIDAEIGQHAGDRQLVGQREVDAVGLRAIAQRGIEQVEALACHDRLTWPGRR